MRYLIGCDFGGGGSKAVLLREDGLPVAESSCEYPTFYPGPGRAEQNPEHCWYAFLKNVKSLTEQSGVCPEEIAALSLDGATHTAVLLDERDRIIRPAIYWTDQRAVKEAQELRESHLERIVEATLNVPGALWTLPQLMWIRKYEPENFARIHKIMSMKDYVRYRLTGDYVTDTIEACGFMLMDVRKGEWAADLCGLAGLEAEVMPRIVRPEEILSRPGRRVQEECGLAGTTKILAGSTDTVMEVYASGAIRPGQATVKLATAGRICAVTNRPLVDKNLVCYPHICPGLWYPGTATKSCAASFRWYRDVFGDYELEHYEDAYARMAEEAQTVEAGSQGLFFHPYLQGELTPYQDETLKGSFTGIRAFHTKAHFNRAVLEGIAYSMKDCLAAIRKTGVTVREASIIGGGAKGTLWCRIMADMLGIPLTKHRRDDSSLGSAMLAGVACGVFSDFEESVSRCVKEECVTQPDPENSERYEKGFETYQKLHDALAEVYK